MPVQVPLGTHLAILGGPPEASRSSTKRIPLPQSTNQCEKRDTGGANNQTQEIGCYALCHEGTVNLVALVDWRFIKLHKRQPGERDMPTSRSLLKLDQALNRGGWAGTLNTH